MFKLFMIVATIISGIWTIVSVIAYGLFSLEWLESLAITAGTCFYHFAMRMAVGAALIPFRKHNPHNRWFSEKPFERKLYNKLKVKRWKKYAPTYDPSAFDMTLQSPESIVNAMCHSELVHESIAVLSFLPLLASIPFGMFGVFLLTSVVAAAYDLSFAIIQRYNRPRVIRLTRRRHQ